MRDGGVGCDAVVAAWWNTQIGVVEFAYLHGQLITPVSSLVGLLVEEQADMCWRCDGWACCVVCVA